MLRAARRKLSMPEIPVIHRLTLSQFRQFRFCDLDLRNPRTGAPLRQTCLLGTNGSGKSSVMSQLYRTLELLSGRENAVDQNPSDALILVGLATAENPIYLAMTGSGIPEIGENAFWFRGEIESSPDWEALSVTTPGFRDFTEFFAEYRIKNKEDYPKFSVPTALSYFAPSHWTVNSRPLSSFQDFLQEKRAERQRQFHEFLQRGENRDRTVAEVEEEFQQVYPGVLFALAELWKETLAADCLAFRPGHEPPFHCLVTGDDLEFTSLGSGLRRYLLSTAELYSRFYLHPEYSGILFLEMPEAGLHPSLVATLMEFYQDLLGEHPGQLFLETHSDEVAARFAPEERFHLQFDQELGIVCSTDYVVTPENPRESSENQSSSTSLRRTGRSPRVKRLGRAIQNTADQDELADLIDEVISLKRGR